jgi:1,4-alpha-glucan branching enzyme
MTGPSQAGSVRPGAADDVHPGEIDRIVAGLHHDPHAVLGAHQGPDGIIVRALLPLAATAAVVLADGRRFPLSHLHEGVFAGALPLAEVPDYRIAVAYPGAEPGSTTPEMVIDTPYRFLPTLGATDLHLIGEGRHEELWRVLGAHVREYGSEDTGFGKVTGTAFAVWAPNARGARVIGDFNHWDGRGHPMRSLGGSGIWELFVPGVGDGTHYKFDICGPDGRWRRKADPMASRTEHPPATASVVYTSGYTWGDEDWLAARGRGERTSEPVSVYEVHLGSWRPGLSYRELAEELTAYVTKMGFTHVELLPVAEHPFGGSWGYQVTSYYAPTARFGSPDDFRYLVDRLHQAGIGVILDWVPAHFPRDDWALARFDGTALYEHEDPRKGAHQDWGTLIFNYGRHEVSNFLIANALYWCDRFHIDGLRVDAVASMLYLDYSRKEGEWLPNQFGGRENLEAIDFLRKFNHITHVEYPGIMTIAEESTAWPQVTRPPYIGGLGFSFKWNMGWMHDTLNYFGHDPVHRKFHQNELTFAMLYHHHENFILPLSHDEVVHGKGSLHRRMPGDDWLKFANLRTLLGYQWLFPGKKLLFMGCEIGQSNEWNANGQVDWWLLDSGPFHRGLQKFVEDLNKFYAATPSLWQADYDYSGFYWIDCNDTENSILSFVRQKADGAEPVAVILNLTPVARANYRIGLPRPGKWREVLNSDAGIYAGSNGGNLGQVFAHEHKCHSQNFSAEVYLPPMSVVAFTP